jgi:hypothetical protein
MVVWPEVKVIVVVRPKAEIFERGGIVLFACPLNLV